MACNASMLFDMTSKEAEGPNTKAVVGGVESLGYAHP